MRRSQAEGLAWRAAFAFPGSQHKLRGLRATASAFLISAAPHCNPCGLGTGPPASGHLHGSPHCLPAARPDGPLRRAPHRYAPAGTTIRRRQPRGLRARRPPARTRRRAAWAPRRRVRRALAGGAPVRGVTSWRRRSSRRGGRWRRRRTRPSRRRGARPQTSPRALAAPPTAASRAWLRAWAAARRRRRPRARRSARSPWPWPSSAAPRREQGAVRGSFFWGELMHCDTRAHSRAASHDPVPAKSYHSHPHPHPASHSLYECAVDALPQARRCPRRRRARASPHAHALSVHGGFRWRAGRLGARERGRPAHRQRKQPRRAAALGHGPRAAHHQPREGRRARLVGGAAAGRWASRAVVQGLGRCGEDGRCDRMGDKLQS
jgi:hypothetical protein